MSSYDLPWVGNSFLYFSLKKDSSIAIDIKAKPLVLSKKA